jgi:serine/threonine-protein kinase
MPQQLGRYKITRQLGSGGMGVVYLAEDTVLGRPVALKTLRILEGIEPSAQQGFAERFLQEARIIAQMDHPGIVAVYDFGYEGEIAYLVLEYVSGSNLAQRLEQGGRLDPATGARILREAGEALDYAHGRGVIHRDVKPANLLLRDDGRVKVADFGIAKLSGAKTMTATGMMLGTVEYMSPEQIRGEPMDGRTDQFSLAVVAYQMITGTRPFQSNSAISLAHKIAYDQPAPASAAMQGLAPEVDRVLAQALDKQPAVRFATCAEFARQLELAWRGAAFSAAATAPVMTPVTVPVATPVTAPVTQVQAREASAPAPRPGKKLLGGLAALLIAAIGVIFALVERSPKAPAAGVSAPVAAVPPSDVPPPAATKKAPPRRTAAAPTVASAPAAPLTSAPVREQPPTETADASSEQDDPAEESTTGSSEGAPLSQIQSRAAKGIPRAMFNLGVAYEKGRGVPRDFATARDWYEKAAAKNHRGAMVALGDLYFKGLGVSKDYTQAKNWYQKAAMAGYREATVRVGDMHLKGEGVPVDFALARHWYEDGAERGSRAAMDRLGDLYYRGSGVPQNYALAKEWYEKSARLGFGLAYFHLARLYRDGDGVARDCNTARDWYAKAAANNNNVAMYNLGQLYSQGCPGFPANKSMANDWYTKAADAGNRQAQEMLHRR